MKPQLVQGTRDFSPSEVFKRQYIFDTLKNIFIRYGFQPLETPAMERLETLTGKYGDEGDQLLFKILNNGDFLKSSEIELLKKYLETEENIEDTNLHSVNKQKERIAQNYATSISKRALRYDLTVPFARYVVMNRNDIVFPFKRYQIQPVWRGDSPQKGRYREFYQCDIDVIGSDSLMYEAELLKIYDQAFHALNLKVQIRLNNRKILEGIASEIGLLDKFSEITVAIDKFDKIGWDGVKKELFEIGLNDDNFEKLKKLISCKTVNEIKANFSTQNSIGQKGIEELEQVLKFLKNYQFKNQLILDLTLARGLSYYTGFIVEVVIDTNAKGQESVKMGSVGGGGRYDNLTGVFGWDGNSGVGISFGADRIYDVMLQLNKFEQVEENSTQLFFMAFDETALLYAFDLVQKCREAGINTEIYPEAAKFQKQMKYADRKNYPFVVIIGEEEISSGLLSVKNMETGEQLKMNFEKLLDFVKQ
jgi:histidyl-tRNA synthetase